MARVVLFGLDGFPLRAVRPDVTPQMWALFERGGRSVEGGVTALPSSTDPGFCTLLTGRLPRRHGVRTTAWRFADLPDWAGSPRVLTPTLFDRCRTTGLKTVAVMGDDRGLLCTDSATERWPPDGLIPAGTPLDRYGYPANAAVHSRLLGAVTDPDASLVFGHFNESDTAGHEDGPESEAARACYEATDVLIGELAAAMRPRWEETVVIIVSDHDMETRTHTPPIDLMADGPAARLIDGVIPDGGAALVHLRTGVSPKEAGVALLTVDGIQEWQPGTADMIIAAARPGRFFTSPALHPGGFHGGLATARTVALVGGGHPAVAQIGARIRVVRPHLADWAPTITHLLGIPPGTSDGRDLLAGAFM